MKNPILDNRKPQTSVGEYLRGHLAGGVEVLRIVSAYFTVYAYEALRGELEKAGEVRFLFGEPGSVGEVDPGGKESKDFDLTERGLDLRKTLIRKQLAKDCEQWIKKKVKIRTIRQTNFLHGKMYHVEQPGVAVAVVGSSNFTHRGLGFNSGANLELNLPITESETCDSLKAWFDNIWNDEQLTKNAKKQVLNALRQLGENCPPELIYFKTLLEIFYDRLMAHEEIDKKLNKVHLKDTKIWKTLYKFQQDGVVGILNRLQQYNGCILADSVGLGKTYTALAVIRHYEEQNKNVLVLCPKKLSENWKLYSAQHNQIGNPFTEDRFRYTILHHTDLSRASGQSNGINLERFNWSAFDLVVIDESHNFRNESRSPRDEHGNIIRRSRYERLLEDIIKSGANTQVLMLSATPVNTTLLDLRSQIYLMTGREDSTYREILGIGNIKFTLNAAQKQFHDWEQRTRVGGRNKQELFSTLSGEFFTLLDAVSIARSREHVKKFYPEVVEEIGGFPEQTAPENETPGTDSHGELSYETLNEEIAQFRLSIYTPTEYVTGKQVQQELFEERERLNFNQADREKWLIGMIRVNFLKRLESAAPSLAKTLWRTIEKIDSQVGKIEKYKATRSDGQDIVEAHPDEDEEDEEFFVNKARHPYHFKDLDLEKWLEDLRNDQSVLNNIYKRVAAITPERDSKLHALESRIRKKWENPSKDNYKRKNRKVLIFTAFKDTAIYLYEQLDSLFKELNANHAMVAGDETRTNYGKNNFNEILTNFAPIGRGRFGCDEENCLIEDGKPEIDILIATDCISEGQNLQDCDLVVNYDIHWNPVRLIQRFGRIDRIGSCNPKVHMVNFWPMEELENYLNLKNRVEARMALADAAATGDSHLAPGEKPLTEDNMRENAEIENNFRDRQLRRLRNEVLDIDKLDESVSLSDFSLDDFLVQLKDYLEKNRKKLENTPNGVYAIADCSQQQNVFSPAAPGVIFCLRQKTPPRDNRARNPLKNYYLIYVRDNGEVRYNYMHAKQILELFGELAREQSKPLTPLCNAFDHETKNGKDMGKYNALLEYVFPAIRGQFEKLEAANLKNRHAILPKKSEQPRGKKDFELVTWLIIKDSSQAS